MNKNIIQILQENAEKFGDKPAIIYKSKQITYKELLKNSEQRAWYYTENGIKKGDKILIFVPMSIELYEILLSVLFIGATAIFLDSWSDKKRLEQAAKIVNCQAFIGIPKAHLLRLFSKEIRKIPLKFVSGFNKPRYKNYCKWEQHAGSLSDTVLITFTTGSTGIPKAAKRTHGFLLKQHLALVNHLTPKVGDVDMTTLPIFVLNNLAVGSTTVIPDFDSKKPENIKPEIIIEEMLKYNVNSSTGSPIFYEKIAETCLLKNKSINTLKKIFLGGSPVFPAIAKKLVKAFPDSDINILYGSTEAEPISIVSANELINYSGHELNDGLCVGKPVKDINIKIIKFIEGPININSLEDFEKIILKNKEIGEICVSGDHVLKEYYNSSEAQKMNKINVNNAIWHRTGDAGYIDNAGNLFLMGRAENRFIFNNKEYYVFPYENMLLKLEQIEIATIIEVKDKVYLTIELKKEYRGHKEEITQQINTMDIPYQQILFVNKIPRDPRHNSKIDYGKLRMDINKY